MADEAVLQNEPADVKEEILDGIKIEGQTEAETKRWKELKGKTDKNPDELDEYKKLTKNYGEKVQKTVSRMYGRNKELSFELEKKDKELKELNERLSKIESVTKNARPPIESINRTTIEVNGKSFYTDEALQSMLENGETTQYKAYQHQRERDKEENFAEWEERQNRKNTEQRNTELRQKDIQKVLGKYAWFDPKHPDHDPNNPLYIEANRIYADGFASNPEGLSKSIELAEKILGGGKKSIDRSEEFSSSVNGRPDSRENVSREVSLTDVERDQAVRLYCFGGMINPMTKRVYTESEALAKATRSKADRLASRRT